MAVYKATYCYPFLNAFDPRIVATKTTKSPAYYLKCKVDTSNKTITGYQIIIRDNENNIVFPVDKNQNNWKISPIQELEHDLDVNGYTNSGINGSYLNIAFIQNLYKNTNLVRPVNNQIYKSFNSIYFTGAYTAQYIISTPEGSTDTTDDPAGNINNWLFTQGASTDKDQLESSYQQMPDWDHTLNGDLLAEGDIIFVKASTTTTGTLNYKKGGLWYVYGVNPSNHSIILRRYTDYDGNFITQATLTNTDVKPLVSITQGLAPRENNKHYYYYFNGNEYIRFINQDPTNNNKCLWVLCPDDWTEERGFTPVDLTIQGGSYKWEIILYQGEGTVYMADDEYDIHAVDPSTIDSEHHLYYIDYNTMSYEYYDMTLTSGQILGSTLTRFQLANKPTDQLISSGQVVGLLPGETSTTPLVLLNKYAQLLNNNNQSSLANRVVVNAFDTTYGHVYFKEGAVTEDIFNQTEKVEFYKYSNIIEDILEGDIVDLATADPVTIGSSYQITKSMFPNGQIDGTTFTQGMKVLIKDATDPRFNGVYIAETGTVDGQDVPWSRAGSYNTWGSFIGKIVCVRQGSQNRGKNFQSQAKAGGTLLIPDGTAQTGVGSYLHFNAEQPIVLFETIPGVNIYQADLCSSNLSFANLNKTTLVDGYNLAIGNSILAKNNSNYEIRKITGFSGNTIIWETTSAWILVADDSYVKIALGQLWGNKTVVPYQGTVHYTNALTSAYILKNTKNYTFISPFVGMTKNNALFFYNKNKIDYDTATAGHPETPSYWLKLQDVYEKFWLIKHYKLSKALDSINPYKYELRSFFKESDENPFFTYEDPYLRLKLNDTFTIGSISGSFQLHTNGRFITLQGEYFQPQQASWSTYQWVLRDYDGNIVQDSGKKYDKNLTTTFYGLNNLEDHNTYFATLYVEDTLNNSLSYTVLIKVTTVVEPIDTPFTATYDCNTQSVILYYEDLPYVKPTMTGNKYSEVYIADNAKNLKTYAYVDWDASSQYEDNALKITGADKLTGAEWGDSDLQAYTGELDDLQLKAKERLYVPVTSLSQLVHGQSYHIHVPAGSIFTGLTAGRITFSSVTNVTTTLTARESIGMPADMFFGNSGDYAVSYQPDIFCVGHTEEITVGWAYYRLNNATAAFDADVVYDGKTGPDAQIIQYLLPYIYIQSNESPTNINSSLTCDQGIQYEHFFSKRGLRTESADQCITLKTSDVADRDEFTFKTDIVLDANYCGQILKLEMDGVYPEVSSQTQNKLLISLSIPDNFTDVTRTTESISRNYIQLDILTKESEKAAEVSKFSNPVFLFKDRGTRFGNYFETFEIPTNQRYYLQFKNSVDDNLSEYLHYGSLTTSGVTTKIKIYFLSVGDKYVPYGIKKQHASNCLITGNSNAGILNYWTEEQNITTYTATKMLENYTAVYDSSVARWPNAESETNQYWCEENNFPSNIPGVETQIDNMVYNDNLANFGFEELVSYKRHPTWNHSHYAIEIIAADIARLYTESALTVVPDDMSGNYSVTRVIDSDNNVLLKVRIKPIID